jgi:hypothetical protein
VASVRLVGFPRRGVRLGALRQRVEHGVVAISWAGHAMYPWAAVHGSAQRARHARQSQRRARRVGIILIDKSRSNGSASPNPTTAPSPSGSPDAVISSGPAAGSTTTATSASFGFSSSMADATFRCSLDGSKFRACTSPKTYSSLSTGTHTFRVEAVAPSGATGTPASRSWTIAAASGGSPPPPSGAQGAWTAPGTLPASDSQAAALVTHQPETRSDNVAANNYVPSDAELSAFHSVGDSDNPLNRYVDGRDGLPNPSTDDLIQWAAHKWGIPEDWIRAEAVDESHWHQSAAGDCTSVSSQDYALYPAQASCGTDRVNQSMGLLQIRWTPEGLHAGSEPLRWKSTAFNLDYYAAGIRYYYDGDCSWCGAGYSAGQQWPSIGAWYSPKPWYNSGAQAYVQRVQTILADRTWAQPGF